MSKSGGGTHVLHGLSYRKSAPGQQRHSQLNDIIWRAIKRAKMSAVKEPVGLMRDDNKRPDGTTLLPWATGKPTTWDVTVPDTYADSHIDKTMVVSLVSSVMVVMRLLRSNQVQQPT